MSMQQALRYILILSLLVITYPSNASAMDDCHSVAVEQTMDCCQEANTAACHDCSICAPLYLNSLYVLPLLSLYSETTQAQAIFYHLSPPSPPVRPPLI